MYNVQSDPQPNKNTKLKRENEDVLIEENGKRTPSSIRRWKYQQSQPNSKTGRTNINCKNI